MERKQLIKDLFFYFALLLLCYSYCISVNYVDYDLFSRLIMGSHIVQTGMVAASDPTSYVSTHTWFDHEWLTSALFYLILNKIGYLGLLFLKIILCFLVFFIIDRNIIQKAGKNYNFRLIYLFIFAIFIYSECGYFYKTLRCQDFSFIFYPIFIYILEKTRLNYASKAIWILPVLNVIWLNSHGASMYILPILLIYGIGEFLNKKPFKNYFMVLVLCSLGYLINPWGTGFIKFMLLTPMVDRSYIAEWKSVSHWGLYIYSMITYLLSQLINVFKIKSLKNLDYTKLMLLLFAFILSFKYEKFAILFIISIAIFLYSDIKSIYDFIIENKKKIAEFLKIVVNYVKKNVRPELILVIFIFFYSFQAIKNTKLNYNWLYNSMIKYPLRSIQFIIDNDLKGNVFTPFQFGGILSYKCYPNVKIHIDGREEQLWDKETIQEHVDFILQQGEKPNRTIFKTKPDIILMPKRKPASTYLQEKQSYYKPIFEDEISQIFVSPKYQNKKYVIPKDIPDFSAETFFKTNINFKKDDTK